jgi:hypothetical protein
MTGVMYRTIESTMIVMAQKYTTMSMIDSTQARQIRGSAPLMHFAYSFAPSGISDWG